MGGSRSARKGGPAAPPRVSCPAFFQKKKQPAGLDQSDKERVFRFSHFFSHRWSDDANNIVGTFFNVYKIGGAAVLPGGQSRNASSNRVQRVPARRAVRALVMEWWRGHRFQAGEQKKGNVRRARVREGGRSHRRRWEMLVFGYSTLLITVTVPVRVVGIFWGVGHFTWLLRWWLTIYVVIWYITWWGHFLLSYPAGRPNYNTALLAVHMSYMWPENI